MEEFAQKIAASSQPCIARIILLDSMDLPEVEEILADPLNVIFPLLLGKFVPTFYSSVGRIVEEKAFAADVTYVDRRMGLNAQSDSPYGDLVAIRFFSQSQTLLVSGLPCSRVSNNVGPRNTGLDRLYELWQTCCNRQDIFRKFPMDMLYTKYLAF
jgi:hypothetical protein